MIKQLKQRNPKLKLYDVHDTEFLKFGKIITEYDFNECIDIMDNKCIPTEGNCYVANDPDLMNTNLASVMFSHFYGNVNAQVGYCNGNTSKLNALEYHKCSELDVAVTDMVLLLATLQQIKNNQLKTQEITGFFLPKGCAVELYSTTLHFAPCKVSDAGFKSIIVLTEGTNAPLLRLPKAYTQEDKLIWMQNKWLIAHEESIPASKGAYIGLIGENIQLNY